MPWFSSIHFELELWVLWWSWAHSSGQKLFLTNLTKEWLPTFLACAILLGIVWLVWKWCCCRWKVLSSCKLQPLQGVMADGSLTFNFFFSSLFSGMVMCWTWTINLFKSYPIHKFSMKKKKKYKLCFVVATFLDQRIDITRVICNIFVDSF